MFQRLFLACGGFDAETACRSGEARRLASIGALVVIPAALATVAFPYWLATMLQASTGMAWLFGPVAGAIVFAIDRALVGLVMEGGLGKKAALLAARLTLSIGIGFAIAEPLVLRAFKPEIDVELAEQSRVATTAAVDQLQANSPEAVERAQLQEKKAADTASATAATERTTQAYAAWEAEARGTGGSGMEGFGRLADARYDEYLAARDSAEALQGQMSKENTELDARIGALDGALAEMGTRHAGR